MDSSGSTAAILPERVIAAILPETNLHAKSSIAAILRQYCQNMLQQIRLDMFSGSIAAILPELDLWIVLAVLPQYCQKGLLRQYCQKLICMRNPVLPQYCGSIARICCSNIAAICQKPCNLVKVTFGSFAVPLKHCVIFSAP